MELIAASGGTYRTLLCHIFCTSCIRLLAEFTGPRCPRGPAYGQFLTSNVVEPLSGVEFGKVKDRTRYIAGVDHGGSNDCNWPILLKKAILRQPAGQARHFLKWLQATSSCLSALH